MCQQPKETSKKKKVMELYEGRNLMMGKNIITGHDITRPRPQP
jgi:hypothetical protein